MQRFVSGVVGIVLAMSVTACSFATPGAGQEAVLIRKPYIFGHGGVDPTPLKTGRSVVAWSTDVEYVEMRPILEHIKFDDLMTKSGVPLDFDSSVRYQVTDSVKLVQQFGADNRFFLRTLEQPFRTAVRDEVKRYELNEMAINASAAEQVDAVVTDKLLKIITETGAPIKLLDVTLGRANPPDAIKTQRIATAEQEQRQITEQQRKLAEDQRRLAEESRAKADNAYREAMSLSPDQYLQLEAIKMQRDVCAGGRCTFLLGGSISPTFDVSR